MIMEEASRHTRYARPKDYWWSSKHVYPDKPRITCPSISRWVVLRSKRVLSTPICRSILFVLTLMVLTSVMLSSPTTDFEMDDRRENVLLRKSTPKMASVRSTAINNTRLKEVDERVEQTTNWTIKDESQPTTESFGPAR
ncbi:uncharacterized protein LOC119725990 [Patiria miniata]|uniref:Uncharacterized protein n=1 Tax=Patiria miniata TaxID=46514 RepID=A0A913ZQ86_PATMI|nr:uncharacterized protein LOC119725990 [Patiria miniata]